MQLRKAMCFGTRLYGWIERQLLNSTNFNDSTTDVTVIADINQV